MTNQKVKNDIEKLYLFKYLLHYTDIVKRHHFVKCECYGSFELVNVYGIARNEVLSLN